MGEVHQVHPLKKMTLEERVWKAIENIDKALRKNRRFLKDEEILLLEHEKQLLENLLKAESW